MRRIAFIVPYSPGSDRLASGDPSAATAMFTTEARRHGGTNNSRRFTKNADQKRRWSYLAPFDSRSFHYTITRFWQLPISSPCLRASVVNTRFRTALWLRLAAICMTLCLFLARSAHAAELRLPDNPAAGQAMTIATSGEGEATLLLIGPGRVIKRQVHLGQDVVIKADELRDAGQWIAVLRGGHSESQTFWVRPGPPESLNFLARPSRVPVARPGVISGLAVIFDKYDNLVLEPKPVTFSLAVNGSGPSQTVTSRNGLAWISSSSARKAGAAQFVASLGDTSVRRVVQQVASDPCNLRMHVAQRSSDQIVVETDPIRDCTGNPVPDGTIVTFTQMDSAGKSTVDARIKKGVARAQLPASDHATITVAAGVVLGNELHVGGGQ